MIEVAVTIGILAMLVVSMTAALGNGFKYLLVSKQRAAASQAANAQLELQTSDPVPLFSVTSTNAPLPALR